MSLTGIPSKDDLTALIKQAATEAQASGLAIEDHLAPLLHDLLHGALLEASTDVSGVLAPALAAIVDLNAGIADIVTESGAWRRLISRLFNLPPEQPK
jgi:hypothetical protein